MIVMRETTLNESPWFIRQIVDVMPKEDPPWSPEELLSMLRNYRQKGAQAILALEGYNVVAAGIFMPSSKLIWPLDHRLDIEATGFPHGLESLDKAASRVMVMVHPDHRGKGLGSQIEAMIRKRMKHQGFTHLLAFGFPNELGLSWLESTPGKIKLDVEGALGKPVYLFKLED